MKMLEMTDKAPGCRMRFAVGTPLFSATVKADKLNILNDIRPSEQDDFATGRRWRRGYYRRAERTQAKMIGIRLVACRRT